MYEHLLTTTTTMYLCDRAKVSLSIINRLQKRKVTHYKNKMSRPSLFLDYTGLKTLQSMETWDDLFPRAD